MAREPSGAKPVPQLALRRQPHVHAVDRQVDHILAQKAEAIEEQRRQRRLRAWLGTGLSRAISPALFVATSSLSAGLVAPLLAGAITCHPFLASLGVVAVLVGSLVALQHYARAVWHALYLDQGTHPTRWLTMALGGCNGLNATPLYTLAAGTSLAPLISVSLLGLAGLATLTLWGPELGCLPSLLDAGVATGAVMASACPWLTTVGLGAAEAAAVGLSLACGVVALASMAALAAQLMARSAPTPMADSLCRDRREVEGCRFAYVGRGDGTATLVDTPRPLLELAAELQSNIQEAKKEGRGQPGMVVSALFGPPGTGKTVSAFGLAQAIDGDVIVTSASELDDAALAPVPVAYVRLVRLLLEANDRGRKGEARPQVVFIDEFDDLFAKLDPRLNANSDYHVLGYKMFASVLGLIAQGDCRISVMLATNHLTREVRELLSMITSRAPIYVGPMTAGGAAKLTGLQLDRLQRHFAQKFGVPLDSFSESSQGMALAASLFEKGASGRHLRYPLAMAQNQTVHAFWAHLATNKAAKDFDLRSEVLDRLLVFSAHVDRRPKRDLSTPSSDADSERHVDIDDFIERIGMQQMSYVEAILNIVEQFWQSYMTSPETSFAINMFGIELMIILLRVSAVYLEQVGAPRQPRGLNDVPLSGHPQTASDLGKSRFLAPVIDAIKTSCSLGMGQAMSPYARR